MQNGSDESPKIVEARMHAGLANARRSPKSEGNASKAKPRELNRPGIVGGPNS